MDRKEVLRTMVKTMYDFQDLRIRIANRLKKKKDGSDQKNVDDLNLDTQSIPVLVDALESMQENEEKLLKEIQKEVETYPIYQHFLKKVKGCGPVMSAVIISEYDITKADTVSKMWQYTGLNPGMVRGKKISGSKKNGDYKVVITNEYIRGDKRTPGFLSPFNAWLRTKMLGVLATSFLRCDSEYKKFYDSYKNRLGHEQRIVEGGTKPWCEESKARRDLASRRYMIKMFIADLYAAWRTLEGLPVRVPCAEEYLSKKHSA